jgi:tetratricopeptide (TPR) repeat protein
MGLAGLSAGCSSATPKDPVERAARSKEVYKEGVNLFNAGDLDAAISRFNEAVKLQPGWSLLRYDLGRLLVERAKRYDTESLVASDKARSDRQKGELELAQGHEDESRRLHDRAIADLNGAREHLLFALDRKPWEPNIYWYLSQVYTGLGDFAQAKEYLEEAIDKGQPTGVTRENLERALQRLETYEEAQDAGVQP